jgi:16S rRNA (adenine1518-N6/adenine1519-N6)-dimethyltransferase
MAPRSIGIRVGLTSISSLPKQAQARSARRPFQPRELRESGVRPSKALGQHFLSDRNAVSKIVSACDLAADDVVIEVGPGLGVLTERLAEAAGRLIAVEIDAQLSARLRERFAAQPQVTIVEADVLSVAPAALLRTVGLPESTPYIVVGNLPYNIGAAILRHFLEASPAPQRLIVMLQREVAASITAAPGDLGLLGVSVQVYAEARRLFNLSPRAFYPPPKVVSTVLHLDTRPEPLVPLSERERFFRVAHAGFSAPRKQLRNSLAQGLSLTPADVLPAIEAAGIDPHLRPEDLSIDGWLRLSRRIEA